MSDFRWSSMVRLIQWLVIKNGFTQDQADAIIDNLRSELRGLTAEKEDNGEIRLALSQRLARYITRLQLGDGVSPHVFENRYQHNYLIIVGIVSAGIWSILETFTRLSSSSGTRLDAELHYEIGNVYLQQGALDSAIGEYDHAIKLDPHYAVAFNNRGVTYGLKGEPDRAIADLSQAIELDPNYVDALNNRGHAYNLKGEYRLAMKDLNRAIDLNANHANAFYDRGMSYFRNGDNDLAIADWDRAIKLGLGPKSVEAEAFYHRATAYLFKYHSDKTNEYLDHAMRDLDRAVDLNPNYAEAFANRAYAHNQKGEYGRAVEDSTRAIRLNPSLVEGFRHRSQAYFHKGEYQRAVDDVDKAIKLKPNDALNYSNRSSAYWHLGMYARAIKDMNEAIKLDPNLAEAFEKRSLAKRMTGDIKGAETDAARAKRLRDRERNPPPARR
jgi:tetratricopeptide (TPR) repeat protein